MGRLADAVFPERIKLITIADYFSIGDRNEAYLDIAPQVTQLAGGVYFSCILEELWKIKLFHWKANERALAAKSLPVIVDFDVIGETLQNVLPELVRMATKRYVGFCDKIFFFQANSTIIKALPFFSIFCAFSSTPGVTESHWSFHRSKRIFNASCRLPSYPKSCERVNRSIFGE